MSEPLEPVPVQSPPVLRPLPRRTPLHATGSPEEAPSQIRPSVLPAPSSAVVFRRTLFWGGIAARFIVRNLGGVVTGRRAHRFRAVRFREALEAQGGNARLFARLLSRRFDLLPYEHCVQLAQVSVDVPPMPIEAALERIEEATGAPLDQVFEALDPQPVVSDPATCVYQAILLGGDPVRVLVRQPGSAATFAGDLQAVAWVLFFIDWLTVLRPEFAEMVRDESRQFVESELDLLTSARNHRLYRRFVEEHKLRGVTAALGVDHLGSDRVYVLREPEGIGLATLVAAVEGGDEVALARFAQRNIHPRKVAKRLLQASWWSAFEGVITHSPSAGDVVVRPGGEVVFMFLEGCGTVGSRIRRMHRELMRRLLRQDLSGAVDAILQMLSPLPYIDVHAFSRTLEQRLGRVLLALRDPEAPWAERTSSALWIAVLEHAQAHGVPVRTEVVRAMRSDMAHHELAARLDPGLDLLAEFARYERRSEKRTARRLRQEWREIQAPGGGAIVLARIGEATDRIERMGFIADAITSFPPIQFLSLTGKAAYATLVMMRIVTLCAALVLGLSVGVLAVGLATGSTDDFVASAWRVASHPGFLAFCAAVILLGMRRIQYRLADADVSA